MTDIQNPGWVLTQFQYMKLQNTNQLAKQDSVSEV